MQATTSSILVGVLLCAAAGARPASPRDDEKKAVPLYTNNDLDRVSPLRAQTGGSTALPETPAMAKPEPRGERRGHHDEAYWRRESERLQDRLQPLRDRAEDLRVRIEERRRNPRVRPYSDPAIESWQRRRAALEQRIREAEDRLHERARREGAPPGWLR